MAAKARLSLMVAGLFGLAVAACPLGEAIAQQQQQPAADIPEEQLDAFADAALDVQQVQQDLNTELQDVESREQAEQLQEEAERRATQAIEAQGLSPEQYRSILQAANSDPELYSTILALMEEKRE